MIQDESEDDGVKWTQRKPCRPFEGFWSFIKLKDN